MTSFLCDNDSLTTLNAEQIAEDLVKRGEIDQAIEIYQHLQTSSSRILSIIGGLYATKKGDYNLAIFYYQNALEIQEKNDEDTSSTLHNLGVIYQILGEYNVALIYHLRALTVRQLSHQNNQLLFAQSFCHIANAYWCLENLSEALIYAQQALVLHESIERNNELNIATNTAILANIYHKSGDDIRALELNKQALSLYERCANFDSITLTTLLNNIGTIEINVGLFNDASLTFFRALNVAERFFPQGHPKRMTVENNIRRLRDLQQINNENSLSQLWLVLSKLLLS